MYEALPKGLILEYDDVFIGKRDHLSTNFFADATRLKQHRIALELIRYAVETRLRWSPVEVRDFLSEDILQKLKLKVLLKYIVFPKVYFQGYDLFYIAWCLYPQTRNMSDEELELRVYKQMLASDTYKIPAEFFSFAEGMRRACNCLSYAIESFHQFPDDDGFSMYEFFAGKLSIGFLKQCKLYKVCRQMFPAPLDFLHTALRSYQRKQVYYSFFSFLGYLQHIKTDEQQEK